ncbi:ATP-dependent DNA helicase [Halofilum ochraceum]|uniref:ATP-dependent DNA helicase n=1 Tax=Halofilum ochraceum TaxID=1611323 RepID=UPI00083329E1|nr:ATP-dependent DNA helicase [Halofilum ochraceum]
MTSAGEALGADGPIARSIDGFAPRPGQQALADAFERTLIEGGALIGEAGTGVGKTFAYLVPALTRGEKIIVSTGTRHLQDQLFHSDLPRVRRALGTPVRAALLKGRSNYLCLHRMELADGVPLTRRPEMAAQLERVRAAARRTQTGDIAEITDVPEDSPIWPYVTSTAENCLGQECPLYRDCHVLQARKAAQEADVVVVNHHLLFADMALKESGFGEVLPSADAFILDEAHQLPDTATNFFGQRISARHIQELARDSIAEHLREAADAGWIRDAAEALEQAARDFRLALGSEARRASWSEVAGDPGVTDALAGLRDAVEALEGELAGQAERGRGLEQCARRARELSKLLNEWLEPDADAGLVQWFETWRTGFALALTPLDIAGRFARLMNQWPAAWLFTSATLSVDGRFDHFRRRLGLDEAEEILVDSPFDYARNALLYLPRGLPEPSHPGYTEAVLEAARPVLAASGGRAFFLFTSYRALHQAAERLRGEGRHTILVQGEQPKHELVERFRRESSAVLLGTASFWEGVDVPGEALSCVIIDKLPFAAPGDPVVQARLDALRAAGGNPFGEYQLPQAAIALKQGAGRLIRGVDDRGVLMLCDPRLHSRGYGRVFLNSLPPMGRTRDLADVERFFDPVPETGGA